MLFCVGNSDYRKFCFLMLFFHRPEKGDNSITVGENPRKKQISANTAPKWAEQSFL